MWLDTRFRSKTILGIFILLIVVKAYTEGNSPETSKVWITAFACSKKWGCLFFLVCCSYEWKRLDKCRRNILCMVISHDPRKVLELFLKKRHFISSFCPNKPPLETFDFVYIFIILRGWHFYNYIFFMSPSLWLI